MFSGECSSSAATFRVTEYGALQHKASNLCVQPEKNPANPMNDEGLTLRRRCDEDSSQFYKFGPKGTI